ncbi:MAG: response regulator [Gallionella sp.]
MMSGRQTILLVEDSDDDYIATTRAFKKVCLRNPIQRCSNGDQVLDYLYQRGEYSTPGSAPRPGMILLDLNLPGTDGREVLRIIKADPQLLQIPVIVLTTSNSEQDIARCYDAGANSYVQKPVDMAGFVAAMGRLKDYWLEVAVLPKEPT